MSFASASSDDLPPIDVGSNAPASAPTPTTTSTHHITNSSSSSFSSLPSPSPNSATGFASPSTHSSRPSPVIQSGKLIKTRSEAGAKYINGRLIMQPLGEGATAEVSLCQDTNTGEYYALKKMSKRTLTKQREYGLGPMGRPKITTGLDKVYREIEIMKDLWHPNILVLQEIIDDPDEDALILVLEYAAKGQIMEFDGKTMKYGKNVFAKSGLNLPSPPSTATSTASSTTAALKPIQHDSPVPEHILRKLLSDVLDGLEYLHSNRIVHRDVKPENLLLGHDGSVKLCDLGVARRFGPDESTEISETQGTYYFFAPEMTTGEKYDAFKQDIWAMGMAFYILVTGGIVPFMSEETNSNPQELFNVIGAHKKGSLLFPDELGLSAEVKDLLNSIMDPNPETRLTINQIRAHPFMSREPTSPLFHDFQALSITSPILVPVTGEQPTPTWPTTPATK